VACGAEVFTEALAWKLTERLALTAFEPPY